jgi:hypothetical protein
MYTQVKGDGGKLKAKAIDVDLAMFESVLVSDLRHEETQACSIDEDCFMFCCGSKCNKGTRKCTGLLTSSNLIVSEIERITLTACTHHARERERERES